MRRTKLDVEFVDVVPESLTDGVIYVSMRFATAMHLCACGCGTEVVTPIAADGWMLGFDGETVSLTPSIGNWSFGCRSHYWVKGGQVHWVEDLATDHPTTSRPDRAPPSGKRTLFQRLRARWSSNRT